MKKQMSNNGKNSKPRDRAEERAIPQNPNPTSRPNVANKKSTSTHVAAKKNNPKK